MLISAKEKKKIGVRWRKISGRKIFNLSFINHLCSNLIRGKDELLILTFLTPYLP